MLKILYFVLIAFIYLAQSGSQKTGQDMAKQQEQIMLQTVAQAVYTPPEPAAPAEQPGVQTTPAPLMNEGSETVITLSFAGDCTLGTDESFGYANSFPRKLEEKKNDYSYFFKGVRTIFEEDDLTLVNLETTLTTATQKANKTFRFKGDPSYVNILKAGSIEMVNVSNNHIYDYLDKGYSETLSVLKEAGIKYSGEGNTAYHPVKGLTIASLGYGGWDLSVKQKLKEDIRKAKEKAELVIVSFHWGDEGSNHPNEVQTQLGRWSIDCGADLVVGHHPHVIQGIEKYKDKYIVYSLGNFCFGGNFNPWDKDSFIFRNVLTVKDKKVIKNEGRIIPCSVSSVSDRNDYQPALLSGEEEKRVLTRIYEYSGGLEYGIKKGG